MEKRYLMMSMMISGPKQPGNDIDVYLAPLIEDLLKLWNEGVEVYDSFQKEHFTLRAMIFCMVNDYPALGNLSGYKIKGNKACVVCREDTHTIRLPFYKKNVYMGHRRHLGPTHKYRDYTDEFDGKMEKEKAKQPLLARKVYEAVKDINVNFGKKSDNGALKHSVWKKKSIFWDLPYWKYLEVRHCLDGMHIIKNVGESIIGLLLNVPGKTKDGMKARKDMVELGIHPELGPKLDKNKKSSWLPAASWTLTKKEKESLLGCLKGIKVPTGYSSNISAKVSMKDNKIFGMKSHDYFVLLTQLLPVAIRGILKPGVRKTITKLCFFYNEISCKVIDPAKLGKLQADLVETICELEMYFPPSFFDIMVHLTIHLVREIRICGPMYLHYMFPFERNMGDLKHLCRSRSRPEGSIVESVVSEEVIEFYTEHMPGLEPIGQPKSRHEGRLEGYAHAKGTITKVQEERMIAKAH
jgi:hypothetical protein